MNPERWARIKSVFSDAAEKPADQQAAFIRSRCEDDESLALEIESLLAAHEQAGEFIEGPAADAATVAITAQLTDALVGSQIGSYEVIREIGRGGMGAVYLARDIRLGRPVALKLLRDSFTRHPNHIRRFEQEARAASALNHPNIVTIYDIGEADIGRFIIMEFIEGRTLRDLSTTPLSLNDLLKFTGQIAKALSVAHAAGIFHRDIKPENVMIRSDGYVKLLDFGVARLTVNALAPSSQTNQVETNPGIIVGTPAYMSPEQAVGKPIGGASDIFSTGIILYELTTGVHPFKRDSQVSSLHAIIEESPIPPSRLNPEIPPSIDVLILQMLEKDPRLRPAAIEVDRIIAELERDGSSQPGADLRQRLHSARRHTVGRQQERRDLQAGFDRMSLGHGLMLSFAGEAGIGKTTLVEDFIADLRAEGRSCVIARGRGSERLAGTEAYLPFLEVLESLTQSSFRQSISHSMRHLAPTWYTQIAPVSNDSSGARLIAEVKGSSQERMKREMVALLQQVSSERPLIIFLDDLHWADASTIDLLAYVATKLDSVRALLVLTYRPSELLLSKHPFSQVKLDLQGRGICHEIALEFLTREDVEHYFALEFPGHNFEQDFLSLVYRKTEGSPLFMTDLLRFLRDRKVIAEQNRQWVLSQSVLSIESEMPESVRSMIQRKIDQLSDTDRRLLVAASVQGYEFDSAVVSKAIGADPAEVEDRLEALERVFAFVRLIGEREFPDKTLTQRHRFVHALYQNALYDSLRPTRRAALNKSVAETLMRLYGEKSSDVASELAYLFEAAREFSRAADYFLLAAQKAVALFAYREAVELARRGLSLLEKLPGGIERSRQELGLHVVLAFAYAVTKGAGAPETGATFRRAREICQQIGDRNFILTAMWGECAYHMIRADLVEARKVADELLELAQTIDDPIWLIGPHFELGFIKFYSGEFVSSHEHFEQAIALHDPDKNSMYRSLFSVDPGVWSLGNTIRTLWVLGYPEQAQRRIEQTLNLAEALSDPRASAYVRVFAASHYRICGEPEKVLEQAAKCIAVCDEHGFYHERESICVAQGWAMAQLGQADEGIEKILESLKSHNARGSMISNSHYLVLLAEAYAAAERIDEALDTVDRGLDFVNASGERHCESDLHRLKGELLLMRGPQQDGSIADIEIEAEGCFQNAIEVARRQKAKSWELHAALSLARFWKGQGRIKEAKDLLEEVYGCFTEGFETKDLKEARVLLDELS